jgi:phage shock protein PspC (stress-responsive transcriptional regulator)
MFTIGFIVVAAIILIAASNAGIRRLGDTNGRVIFGVCGGLARHFQTSTTLVRVLAVLLLLSSVGGVVPIYLLMALVLPRDA